MCPTCGWIGRFQIRPEDSLYEGICKSCGEGTVNLEVGVEVEIKGEDCECPECGKKYHKLHLKERFSCRECGEEIDFIDLLGR